MPTGKHLRPGCPEERCPALWQLIKEGALFTGGNYNWDGEALIQARRPHTFKQGRRILGPHPFLSLPPRHVSPAIPNLST